MASPERELGRVVIAAPGHASWVGPDGKTRIPNAGQSKKLSEDGDIFHYMVWSDGNNNIHNESGPGVVMYSMDENRTPRVLQVQYWQNGVVHRDDGPAVIHPRQIEYYQNGKLHRSNAPAVISDMGDQIWYVDGLLHREDGPAIIESNGDRYWAHMGYLHRDDGPAIIDGNTGNKLYYRHGYQFHPDQPEFHQNRMPETDLQIDWGGGAYSDMPPDYFPERQGATSHPAYGQDLSQYVANGGRDSTYQPSDDMDVSLRSGKALYIASEWEDIPFTHHRRRKQDGDNPPVGGINIVYRH